MRTPVVFRVWRKGGDILALLPTIPADNRGHLMQSYQHIGQHGAAEYWTVLSRTRPLKTSEEIMAATELLNELRTIGYTDLETKERITPIMHEARKQAAVV